MQESLRGCKKVQGDARKYRRMQEIKRGSKKLKEEARKP